MVGKVAALTFCLLLMILAFAVYRSRSNRLQVYSANGIRVIANGSFGDVKVEREFRVGNLRSIVWEIRDYYGSLDVVNVISTRDSDIEITFADGSKILCHGSGTYEMGKPSGDQEKVQESPWSELPNASEWNKQRFQESTLSDLPNAPE